MSKGFGISSILDCDTGDEMEIRTDQNGETEQVTISHLKGDGTREKITDKEKVWNFFREQGFSDEQIAGVYGNMTQYKIAPYPGTDIIEIPNAKVSEIEHWPNDTGSGEYFKHKLTILPYDMEFTYRIDDKRVLLESVMLQDARLGFWMTFTWETIKPFRFLYSTGKQITNDIPFKSWEEYFSVESIKKYAIEHGAHENFLEEEGMFY